MRTTPANAAAQAGMVGAVVRCLLCKREYNIVIPEYCLLLCHICRQDTQAFIDEITGKNRSPNKEDRQ